MDTVSMVSQLENLIISKEKAAVKADIKAGPLLLKIDFDRKKITRATNALKKIFQ